MDEKDMATARAEHETWLAMRREQVLAPHGNLALVAFEIIGEEPVQLGQLPVTMRRVGQEDGLRVQASAVDGVCLDSQLVGGEVFMERLRADGSPLLTWGRFTVDVFSLDGRSFEARIYDAQAPAREAFETIQAFPYDPAMVFEAELDRTKAGAVGWSYSRESDEGSLKQVPGELLFEHAGDQHRLVVFLDGSTGVVVFADQTTGAESHAPGRFVKFEIPEQGPVLLDFNRAFIPPCGFSDNYSCPLPPASNRLSFAVAAGEARVAWK